MAPRTDNFSEVFALIPESEDPKQISVDGVPYILHEDHRWVLPIVQHAQAKGLLPKPCTVVIFDWHHDTVPPYQSAADELKKLRTAPTIEGIITLCAKRLRSIDDDWLKAGMELGVFGDAVIFGVDDWEEAASYKDHVGNRHRIEFCALPKSALSERGQLSDLIRRDDFGSMWETLGWNAAGRIPGFTPGLPKIFLTIDLDCFAIPWRDYTFTWPDAIFESEFRSKARRDCWTGASFLQELASKAGLVTIAREAGCCGGRENAETILAKLIHYGFDDRFTF